MVAVEGRVERYEWIEVGDGGGDDDEGVSIGVFFRDSQLVSVQ
jgi:hypothetical protein